MAIVFVVGEDDDDDDDDEATLMVMEVFWMEKVLVMVPLHKSKICRGFFRSSSVTFITPFLSSKNTKPILPRFTRLGFEINHCSISLLLPLKSY